MAATDILVKVGADITDFSRKMAESQRALSTFSQKNKATFDAFKVTGAVVTAAGVGIATGLGKAVKTAANFESGMSKVAAVSGATGKDFDDLSAKAREMGSQTSFSATDAADGLQYMALAGWNTQQMLGGIEPILHLAEAGALDLGRASDLVTDSMSALGVEVGDLDGYLDKVAKTSASANTDIDALMEAFVIAGGTFKRFNVPLAEANAFLGTMANRGFKGSEAGTAINAIMTRLSASTGPAAKALKDIGVKAFDSSGKFRGMETVMKDVEKKLSSMTDKERAHYQTQIAGLNHGKAFDAMLGGLGEEYDSLKGKIEDSSGALKEMRDIMKDNLQGALENLSSAFEEILISIGTALLPAIKSLTGFLQSMADSFNGLSEPMKSFIAIATAVVGVLALITGPILLLIGFIPQIIVGFQSLGVVIGALSGPVGWIILAIVGIGTALVVAYKKVEWFRDMVDAAWAWIKDAFFTAISWIKDNVVIPIMTEVASFISEILEKVKGYWDKYGDLILSTAQLYFDSIWQYIKAVMGVIKGIFEMVWPIIAGIVKITWNTIKTVIRNTMDIIEGIIDTIMLLIQGDWEGAWNRIKQIGEDIWKNIQRFFEDIDLYEIGRNILDGLIKGFNSMKDSVIDSAKNIGQNIKDAFTGFFSIHSPSRLMASLSKHIPGGAIVGMESMLGKVRRTTDKLSEAMTPETRDISMDYATPSGAYASLAGAVNGTVDVNAREDMIAGAIGRLEAKLENLRIEMDGKEFGRAVSDVSEKSRDSAVRSGGRRRI